MNFVHTDYFTDEEWASIQTMLGKYAILENMSEAVALGKVRGFIIYGPPGVSKTFTVKKVLDKSNTQFYRYGEEPEKCYKSISGYMRTPHLFAELWDNRNEGDILLIDDCDSALQDEDSLMLLKAALDTTEDRIITYNAQSPLLKQRKIPNTFEFNGRIIFVTNTDFRHNTTPKLKDHLQAIIDRCHYLDLAINTDEEKQLWVKYVSYTSDILTSRGVDESEIEDVLKFVEANDYRIADVSLRTIIKVAELMNINHLAWKELAEHTMFNEG